MKLSSTLTRTAGIVMLGALSSSSASAQRADVAGAMNTMPRPPHWTATNVTAEQPFGKIDVTPAGSSIESVRLWTLGRSVSERYEINGRCAVITTPGHAARYSESDQQFCRNYAMVGFARPMTPRS